MKRGWQLAAVNEIKDAIVGERAAEAQHRGAIQGKCDAIDTAAAVGIHEAVVDERGVDLAVAADRVAAVLGQ